MSHTLTEPTVFQFPVGTQVLFTSTASDGPAPFITTVTRHFGEHEADMLDTGPMYELADGSEAFEDELTAECVATAAGIQCADCKGTGYSGGVVPVEPELCDACEVCLGEGFTAPIAEAA
ncbi:hypothetical protein [Sphingomonas albertensis]|uniref:Uncharacterized protein n=1 Tax=Sphingomonas albertensis TaxID=2762591 RepID=A0ABR7ATR3_9SPHN|nr:hypothetical protein [Sphingomonas albertensis]MBC3943327.1 hypothetical protein [Sphingomonas albertensis]